MKERPILFNGPMVRAILEGRKTMTRRVVQFPRNRDSFVLEAQRDGSWWPFQSDDGESSYCYDGNEHPYNSPYGKPKDLLWVRESACYNLDSDGDISSVCTYKADAKIDHKYSFKCGCESYENAGHTGWRPSIFMPRWASRLTMEIVSVRVERLQDISEEDCFSEGIPRSIYCPICNGNGDEQEEGCCICEHTGMVKVGGLSDVRAQDLFHTLWDSINIKRGYGWDANPWVWVIEFKRV